ncbi:hypothetical protein [Oligoflexus tunisiensis]|uniref:hypothetical protein n=1 Tax=Oligoflexus tunisiensis TaxID=708132 RepID=UPI00114CE8F2|nr:hypothetical protein [Oligoflexus tunisiensis]
MKKLSWGALFVELSLMSPLLLAKALPLSFHLTEESEPSVLTVLDYEMKKMGDHELSVRLKPEDAKALGQITSQNLGRRLILKQGERVLASPAIKAAIQGPDFVVSTKK